MSRPRGTLLLFPGAGASRDQPTLVRLATDLAPRWTTVRADFPYRRAGRRAPDRPPVLMQAVRDELAAIRTRRVFAGGRSMGGRICSMVAAGADGLPAPRLSGLVLISYPLHPPGRPDRLRVDHLPALSVPCLFVHGTKDPFGSPDELRAWTATIPGPVTHHWVEGTAHDLKGRDAEVAQVVGDWLATQL